MAPTPQTTPSHCNSCFDQASEGSRPIDPKERQQATTSKERTWQMDMGMGNSHALLWAYCCCKLIIQLNFSYHAILARTLEPSSCLVPLKVKPFDTKEEAREIKCLGITWSINVLRIRCHQPLEISFGFNVVQCLCNQRRRTVPLVRIFPHDDHRL